MGRLIRPGMEPIFIGIDPQSNYLNAVALWKGIDSAIARRYHLADASGATACRNAQRATHKLLDELYSMHPNPGKTHWRVAIEKAIAYGAGRGNSTIAQCYTTGAILAALADRKARVSFVAPSQWKKVVIGNGSANKRRVATTVRHRWPNVYESLGGSQDLIDAYCIARYASNNGAS